MRTLTFSDARAHFAETLNKVVDDREPVIVTRANREAVVIMALDDDESMRETIYSLRSPRRINDEHRLVHFAVEDEVRIAQCRDDCE